MHDEEPGIILLAFESNAAATSSSRRRQSRKIKKSPLHQMHSIYRAKKEVPLQLDDLDIFLFNRNHIVLNRNQNSVH